MPRYYWIPTLIAICLLWIYLFPIAWHYVSQPIVLDYFWSPVLKMYEPVEVPPLTGFWYFLTVPWAILVVLWHLPLYVLIPSVCLFLWCGLLLWAYRPCLPFDYSEGKKLKLGIKEKRTKNG